MRRGSVEKARSRVTTSRSFTVIMVTSTNRASQKVPVCNMRDHVCSAGSEKCTAYSNNKRGKDTRKRRVSVKYCM